MTGENSPEWSSCLVLLCHWHELLVWLHAFLVRGMVEQEEERIRCIPDKEDPWKLNSLGHPPPPFLWNHEIRWQGKTKAYESKRQKAGKTCWPFYSIFCRRCPKVRGKSHDIDAWQIWKSHNVSCEMARNPNDNITVSWPCCDMTSQSYDIKLWPRDRGITVTWPDIISKKTLASCQEAQIKNNSNKTSVSAMTVIPITIQLKGTHIDLHAQISANTHGNTYRCIDSLSLFHTQLHGQMSKHTH